MAFSGASFKRVLYTSSARSRRVSSSGIKDYTRKLQGLGLVSFKRVLYITLLGPAECLQTESGISRGNCEEKHQYQEVPRSSFKSV